MRTLHRHENTVSCPSSPCSTIPPSTWLHIVTMQVLASPPVSLWHCRQRLTTPPLAHWHASVPVSSIPISPPSFVSSITVPATAAAVVTRTSTPPAITRSIAIAITSTMPPPVPSAISSSPLCLSAEVTSPCPWPCAPRPARWPDNSAAESSRFARAIAATGPSGARRRDRPVFERREDRARDVVPRDEAGFRQRLGTFRAAYLWRRELRGSDLLLILVLQAVVLVEVKVRDVQASAPFADHYAPEVLDAELARYRRRRQRAAG